MMFTARQLEQMHRETGSVVLPYRARLTPLAVDWVRAKRIVLGYADLQVAPTGARPHPGPLPEGEGAKKVEETSTILWWCDGPCGIGKAAISQIGREIGIAPVAVSQDVRHTLEAVKFVAKEIKSARAGSAIFILENASAALMYANRSAVLRAILGTTLTAVDRSITDLAPNVLAIEHAGQSLQQAKNMMLRFARGRHGPSDAVAQSLKEMAACA